MSAGILLGLIAFNFTRWMYFWRKYPIVFGELFQVERNAGIFFVLQKDKVSHHLISNEIYLRRVFLVSFPKLNFILISYTDASNDWIFLDILGTTVTCHFRLFIFCG